MGREENVNDASPENTRGLLFCSLAVPPTASAVLLLKVRDGLPFLALLSRGLYLG